MEKFVKQIALLAIFLLHSSLAWCQDNVDTVIVKPMGGPILGVGGTARRAPARGVVVPTVIQYKTTEALKFVADEDCAPIPYTIYNEDSVAVLSGTLLFDENGECTVSIRSLAAGNYRLQLEIRNRLYVGLFCKEEE